MSNFTAWIVGILTIVGMVIITLWVSHNFNLQEHAETQINEAMHTFIETVVDRGALHQNDVDLLLGQLVGTGGTFEFSIVVNRLFPIPHTSPLNPHFNTAGASGFVMDFRPIHGFSTMDGSLHTLDEPLILRRHDNLSIVLRQATLMPHQLNQERQFGFAQTHRTWTFSRAVRNDGNAQVGNEAPPIRFDGL